MVLEIHVLCNTYTFRDQHVTVFLLSSLNLKTRYITLQGFTKITAHAADTNNKFDKINEYFWKIYQNIV